MPYQNATTINTFIFEIQDTLLDKISSDDMIGRKVESQIEQRKLLGIKPNLVTMLLASIVATKDLNQKVREDVEVAAMDVVVVVAGPRVKVVQIATTVEVSTHQESVQHTDRSVTIVMARMITVVYVNPGQGPKVKNVAVKKINKIGNLGLKTIKNQVTQDDSDEVQYNDYDEIELQDYDSVMTLYYHDVRIHSNHQHKCKIMYNLKMTLHGKKSCLNRSKIGIGADGNNS